MTALLTLEEIKAHLRVDHDADDDMLMDKVRQATAVLLAYIQGSRDKVIREDGELIPGGINPDEGGCHATDRDAVPESGSC